MVFDGTIRHTAIMQLSKVLQMLFGSGANPHLKEFVEYSRVTSPLGLSDAVLVPNGSANYELYIVPKGKALFGQTRTLVFIHCHSGAPKVSWKDESTLLCENTCEVVSSNRLKQLHKESDAFVLTIRNT